VVGVLRLRFSILERLASSVSMEAARFLVVLLRVDSRDPEEDGGGGGGGGGLGGRGPEDADKGAVGEVSDPCCLAVAGSASLVSLLVAMAERVRGPVIAEWWCRG
jgi:hypothetical protein